MNDVILFLIGNENCIFLKDCEKCARTGMKNLKNKKNNTMLFPNGNKNDGDNMSKVKLQTAAEIGALIRTKRKEQHVSQAVLAGLASVGTRFISDLENGKGTIQIQKLLDVLNALGLGLYIFNRWEND
jgi:y4mF family transcriptional regulator